MTYAPDSIDEKIMLAMNVYIISVLIVDVLCMMATKLHAHQHNIGDWCSYSLQILTPSGHNLTVPHFYA